MGGVIGTGSDIRLRGNKSVSMSNTPIVYIDGIRMQSRPIPEGKSAAQRSSGNASMLYPSPLNNINPSDIERIEVIKGSAATTLYGTEASAGVIQVFTKRGAAGRAVWTAEMQQGTGWVQKFGINSVDYLNMEHFFRDAWWGGGYEGGSLSRACITDDTGPPENLPADLQARAMARNAWWQGQNNKTPQGACSWPGAQWYQTYHLSVRGGGQALQYYISGQYQNDEYTLPDDHLDKYNFQGNFTMSPIENFQLQWNTGYTHEWVKNTPTGNNLSGLELQSFRQERNYFANGDPRVIAEILDYDYETTIERLTTGATATYSPLANLTNRFTIGYDHIQRDGLNQMPFNYWELPEGMTVANVYQRRLLTFDYVSTFRFGLTQNISSNFSWGGQAIGDDEHRVHAQGENFPGAVEPTVSSGALQRASEDRQKVWNAGFFLQNVFDIKNRYFVTAGLRVDGNSAFGEGFGLQMYPKLSGTWVASDEGFWNRSWGSIKLRAAYGQSGRAPGAFDAVRTWNPVGYAGQAAFRPENVGNPDLGPEVTGELELGFDAAWLDDRIRVAFTHFRQKTTDALLNVSQMPSSGFTRSQLENVGALTNRGIELQLDANVVNRPVWGLELGVGVSTNHSNVVDLGGIPPFSSLSGRIAEGYPVPAAWDDKRVANRDSIGPYRYIRCEPTADELAANKPCDQGRGIFVGSLYPTHFVNPSLTLRVPGNVTVAARGEYRGGNYREVNQVSISRSVRSPLCFPYYKDPTKDIALKDDTPALWRERCTPAGGDEYWFDADYFKLRSVSATIPVDFAFPERVSNPTITLTLSNFWDWYREVPWFDMESGGDNGAASEDVASQSERTPAPATLRISLRATF
jgi:hypothetical protein